VRTERHLPLSFRQLGQETPLCGSGVSTTPGPGGPVGAWPGCLGVLDNIRMATHPSSASVPTEGRRRETSAAVLPAPLTTLRHPLRFGWNTIQQLGWTVLLAYLGMLFFVTVYYLAFEVDPTVNHAWHRLVPSADVRHLIRNVGEGLFGGLFARAVAWNHYRKKVLAPTLSRADRIEQRLGVPNLKDGRVLAWWHPLSLLVFVPLYAAPGFLIGFGIRSAYQHDVAGLHEGLTGLFGHLRVHLSTHPHASSVADRIVAGLQANWDQKLIGYLAAFVFGRRVATAVIDDLQLVLARRHSAIAKGQKGRLWRVSPPGYRARCNDITASNTTAGPVQGVGQHAGQQRGWRVAIQAGTAVAVGFMIAGEIILTVVAPG
jgi:hypothetical protein